MASEPASVTRARLPPLGINSLPLELLKHIFTFLQTKAKLLIVARVCRRWHLAVPDSVHSLVISTKKTYRVKAFVAPLFEAYRYVTDLTVAVAPWEPLCVPLSTKRLRLYAGALAPPYPTALTHLTIKTWGYQLPSIYRALSELATALMALDLTLTDEHVSGHVDINAELISKLCFPVLRYLHINVRNDDTAHSLIRSSPSLVRLDVTDGQWITRTPPSMLTALVSARRCFSSLFIPQGKCPNLRYWASIKPRATHFMTGGAPNFPVQASLFSEMVFNQAATESDLVWQMIAQLPNLHRIYSRHQLPSAPLPPTLRLPLLRKFSLSQVGFLESLAVARFVLRIAPSLRKLYLITQPFDEEPELVVRHLTALIVECHAAGVQHLVAVVGYASSGTTGSVTSRA